jgi:hypothetical protein
MERDEWKNLGLAGLDDHGAKAKANAEGKN